MKCKYCQAELEEGVSLCPVCGKEQADTPVQEPVTEEKATSEIKEGIKATPGKIALAVVAGIVVLALACTLGGHALMTYLLGFVSADVVSFALLGEPIGAALWALLLFREPVTLPLLVGGMTVIAGLAMYTYGEMLAAKREGKRN